MQARVVIPSETVITDAVVVLTTVATEDEAMALVRALLDRRLIACGTLLPGARSLYRWEDRIADLALPISTGMEQYLGWIGRET
jgi:periplasmic divalent cation tolerance protein